MKVKQIIVLSFVTLATLTLTSKVNSSEVTKVTAHTANEEKRFDKSENTTISTYQTVMANYSEEEVDNFFASRNVTDDTVIFAPKSAKGGFFLFEGDNTTVVNENEGVVTVVDATAPNQSATVGEVKEALKENQK